MLGSANMYITGGLGVTDQVYLPDFKYISAETAGRYSKAKDYFDFALPAIKEMLRQTVKF